jgi:hypothetical protein
MAFLPYLPQDNASLADATVAAISERLGELLRAPASQFWTAVRGDASLHTCLDSYLQYARCARGRSNFGAQQTPPAPLLDGAPADGLRSLGPCWQQTICRLFLFVFKITSAAQLSLHAATQSFML